MNWLPRKTVVVPVDFSDESFTALETALEMIEDPADLHVVHVLPTLEANDPGVIWQMIDDESRSHHAHEALQEELVKRRYEVEQIAICFGDPGHEIAEYAKRVDAGLVTISSHGRSAWSHLLIGSVAERVVRLSGCPVLVLKK